MCCVFIDTLLRPKVPNADGTVVPRGDHIQTRWIKVDRAHSGRVSDLVVRVMMATESVE
jgi:hypothetical protein